MPSFHAILALTLCVLPAAQEKPKPQKPPLPAIPAPKAKHIVCTSNSVQCDDEPAVAVDHGNPIVIALNRAAPGAQVELRAGEYKAFTLGAESGNNVHGTSGTADAPIVVQGEPGVRVRGDSFAMQVLQATPCSHFTFKDVEFVPGKETAIDFANGEGWVHRGFRFERCDIDGSSLSPATGESTRGSANGLEGWGLADFVFEGPANVSNLVRGHAFELHHPSGDVTIEGVTCARIGQSFIELTSAAKDGAPGKGTITIANCDVADCGLVASDGKEGQSAFSFGGRHEGEILLRKNKYRAGFVEELRKATTREIYGTGALELWCGDDGVPTQRLTLDGNDFEMYRGCGDRALVALSACGDVEFRHANRFVAGSNTTTLQLEPPRRQRPEGAPIDTLHFAQRPVVLGTITWRGMELSLSELADKYPGAETVAEK